MPHFSGFKIAIIGLGYVGLPLAVEFAKKYPVVGFDINLERIKNLDDGIDTTLEVENFALSSVKLKSFDLETTGIYFTGDQDLIKHCNVFIITVPTPVDKNNRPDLTPLFKASELVGRVIKSGDIVIYESTVYPGVTEDECIPVIEKASGLLFNKDFFAGYSPERINPGDKEHTVSKILKITSGSTSEAAEIVDMLYKSIIVAGTHRASSIKVAEAAKVIENSQRDINIAFVNELAKIFGRLGIDTDEVLQAAGSKWNFLKFSPGLVGGHCIGVDPYYLAQKAQEVGYHPEIILAGRRLNDGMALYIADEVIKLMLKKRIHVDESDILILGFTFKENCPDIRNTKVLDLVRRLQEYNANICIYDPWANPKEVNQLYGLTCVQSLDEVKGNRYDAVIAAVSHDQFLNISLDTICKEISIVYDIKGILPKELTDARL